MIRCAKWGSSGAAILKLVEEKAPGTRLYKVVKFLY